jgi:hypothetical protein
VHRWALLTPLPTDKNALRFWVLQGYNATHIDPLVNPWIKCCKITTDFMQPLYALVDNIKVLNRYLKIINHVISVKINYFMYLIVEWFNLFSQQENII